MEDVAKYTLEMGGNPTNMVGGMGWMEPNKMIINGGLTGGLDILVSLFKMIERCQIHN